jgi:hypothetical protein
MSVEQRRITRLKKKKIAKFQKLVKNKAAEFKRKNDKSISDALILAISTAHPEKLTVSRLIKVARLQVGVSLSSLQVINILDPFTEGKTAPLEKIVVDDLVSYGRLISKPRRGE